MDDIAHKCAEEVHPLQREGESVSAVFGENRMKVSRVEVRDCTYSYIAWQTPSTSDASDWWPQNIEGRKSGLCPVSISVADMHEIASHQLVSRASLPP